MFGHFYWESNKKWRWWDCGTKGETKENFRDAEVAEWGLTARQFLQWEREE